MHPTIFLITNSLHNKSQQNKYRAGNFQARCNISKLVYSFPSSYLNDSILLFPMTIPQILKDKPEVRLDQRL